MFVAILFVLLNLEIDGGIHCKCFGMRYTPGETGKGVNFIDGLHSDCMYAVKELA
jgi:hypothetical protein